MKNWLVIFNILLNFINLANIGCLIFNENSINFTDDINNEQIFPIFSNPSFEERKQDFIFDIPFDSFNKKTIDSFFNQSNSLLLLDKTNIHNKNLHKNKFSKNPKIYDKKNITDKKNIFKYNINNSNLENSDQFKFYINHISNGFSSFLDLCDYEDEDKMHSCAEFVEDLLNFFTTNTNFEIIINDIIKNEGCSNDLLNSANENFQPLKEILGSSGKNLQDYGLEDECINFGHNYYFVSIELNDTTTFRDKSYSFLYNFLQFDSYNYGFCFFKNCSNFINNFFNETSNPEFYRFLANTGFRNITITDKNEIKLPNYFYYQVFIFILYLIFKIICTFFCYFNRIERKKLVNKNNNNQILNEDDKDYKHPYLNDHAEKSNITDKYIDLNYLNESEEILIDNGVKDKNYKTFLYGKMQKTINYFYEFFSYNKNFIHLTDVKNQYYDDKNIESLNFIKALLLFTCTFNHVFYTSIIFPHRDFFDIKYFYNFMFGFFKISNYALDCYISLEALTMSFKLMNYVKKNGSDFKIFMKFYLFSVPKLFLFFLIYFSFQSQFLNYGIIFGNNFTFNKILIEKFRKKECFRENVFLIFNYPYLCYNDNESESFEKCFKFTYVYINMFICFNIFLTIFYFSLKMKTKKFDYSITFIFLALFSSIFINFDWNESEKYTFSLILGELLSFKFLHLFAMKYFIGILGGLFFFYSNETVLTDSYINNLNYLPFCYVYDYIVFLSIKKSKKNFNSNNNMINSVDNRFPPKSKSFYISQKIDNTKFMDKSNNSGENYNTFINEKKDSKKIIFIGISIIIQLFLGFYYIVKILIFNNENEILDFTLDFRILYFYERHIFLFFFMVMITALFLTKNTIIFTTLLKSKLFLMFGRINFAYFCVLDTVVYLFFTVYDIELFFSYQNMFFMTLGISVIIFIFGFLLVYLFELPIRKLIKLFN